MKTVLDVREMILDQFGHPFKVVGLAFCGDVQLRWTLYFGHRTSLNIMSQRKTQPTKFLAAHFSPRHWTNRKILPELLNNLMLVIGEEFSKSTK